MSRDVIVIGAGGHAKVCVEILRDMNETVGFCVGGKDSPEECLGVKVLKGDENIQHLRARGYSRAFIAIGSNRLRSQLGDFCLKMGYKLVSAISSHAVISPSAFLKPGVAVMAGAVINADTTIGDLAIINTGATIDHDCIIGRNVHIAPQCGLAGNVTVGDQSFIGIGSKAIPGVTIGERVIAGAGSVIIDHIPPDVTVVGVPARIV